MNEQLVYRWAKQQTTSGSFKVADNRTDEENEDEVIDIFYKSLSIYGSRKIKVELQRKGIYTSRRRISIIMRKHDLVSVYTKKKYRNHSSVGNESKMENLVNRAFNDRDKLQVVVSDLTYVRVGSNWNYAFFNSAKGTPYDNAVAEVTFQIIM